MSFTKIAPNNDLPMISRAVLSNIYSLIKYCTKF